MLLHLFTIQKNQKSLNNLHYSLKIAHNLGKENKPNNAEILLPLTESGPIHFRVLAKIIAINCLDKKRSNQLT